MIGEVRNSFKRILSLNPNNKQKVEVEDFKPNQYVKVAALSPYFVPQTTKYEDNEDIDMSEFQGGDFENYTRARIENMDEILKGFEKYKTGLNRNREGNMEYFEEIVYFLMDLILPWMDTRTMEFPDIVNQMRGGSSAGFLTPGNKNDAFAKYFDDVEYYFHHPRQFFFDNTVLWTVVGKDEVRLKEKEPRTYSFPDLIFTMLLQKYTIMQNKSLMENWKQTPFAVGITENDWTDLIDKLETLQPKKWVMWDASRYDRSIPTEAMEAVFILRSVCHSETDKDTLAMIYSTIINRLNLLPNGEIYLTQNGNPSGQANTTIDNCIAHVYIWATMWCKYTGSIDGFEKWLKDHGWIVYGDDGLMISLNDWDEAFFSAIEEKLWTEVTGSTVSFFITDDPSAISFLGKHPIKVNGVWRSKPSEPAKNLMSLKLRNKKSMTEIQFFTKLVNYYELFYNYDKTEDKAGQMNKRYIKTKIDTFISNYHQILKDNTDYQGVLRTYKVEIPKKNGDFDFRN